MDYWACLFYPRPPSAHVVHPIHLAPMWNQSLSHGTLGEFSVRSDDNGLNKKFKFTVICESFVSFSLKARLVEDLQTVLPSIMPKRAVESGGQNSN